MKTFYHVTLKENYEKIKNEGLVPSIGTLSQLAEENVARVYLFPSLEDMENALLNWLGEQINDEYGEDVECCSLKIDLPDTFPISFGEIEYEVYSYDTIPPQYISYLKDE